MFQGNKSDEQAHAIDAKEKKQSAGWASLSPSKLVRIPYSQESKEREDVPEKKPTYFVDSDCFSPAWKPGLAPNYLLQLR